jgi:SAM-dependent methyltransferase
MDHADPAYLTAKRTVDDRALDRRVRDHLLAELPDAPRVLEAGPGVGATVDRLADWGVGGTYRGVDADADVVAAARERHADGAGAIAFEAGDALTAFDGEDADLLVAQSFYDLVPVDRATDAFADALRPGGLLYAPITFDGETVFQPDHPADDAVTAAYHDAIDAAPGRDVHAGRHLLDHLRRRPGDLLAVGASDWVVRPRDGAYPADERHFLDAILGFVADAVADVDGAGDWLDTRRRQVDDATLSYVAHGYDILYRVA